MATVDRDYYELLGLTRTADEQEIKKAFRRLARELHPDVSDAPDAEERFKEIVEAYEVLSDPERRDLYDRYGHAGLRSRGYAPSGGDFANLADLFSAFFGDDLFGVGGVGGGRGRGQRRAARGADVAAEIEIDLVDAARGTRRNVPFSVLVACPTCGGSGRVQQVSTSVFGQFIRTQTCGRCRGEGQIVERPCRDCDGAGRVLEE